jgi:hypothetical protein
MAIATVRVRPLRLAFLVEPNDKGALQRVFEINTALWGGIFNFVIPLFKLVPERYREQHFKTIPAVEMLKGFVEAFQPDYLVEVKAGAAAKYAISFPSQRILNMVVAQFEILEAAYIPKRRWRPSRIELRPRWDILPAFLLNRDLSNARIWSVRATQWTAVVPPSICSSPLGICTRWATALSICCRR